MGTDLSPHAEAHLRVVAIAISDATDLLAELSVLSLDLEAGEMLLGAVRELARAAEALDLAVSNGEVATV